MRPAPPTYEDKVAFLRRPKTYGARVRAVRCIQTHFASVFLAGRDVYKLKKPLRHKELDYRTLAARKAACLEEVRLNRRFAPRVYLGVMPLTATDGELSLGGNGEVVDWLVRMRRLPDTHVLDRALRGSADSAAEIDRLARTLVLRFRQAAPRPIVGARYLERLSREIRANRRDIARHGDGITQRLVLDVYRAQRRALEELRPALAARGRCVVDGHGDLRAEHVYLGRPIAIIDGLEFDRRLRRLDPADEVSLLALEMERLGHGAPAQRLIEKFRDGMDVPATPELFSFYKSHRAATRAKLAAWHIDDPQFPDAAPWIARAESLLEDALRHARAACVGRLEGCGGAASDADRRPAVEKWSKRRAGDHAADRFGKQWSHMQLR